jgi:ABC-type oligopeptide transport system substrate-binding subunit
VTSSIPTGEGVTHLRPCSRSLHILLVRTSVCALLALLLVVGLVPPALDATPGQPVRGGVLRIAHSGEPPTLDLHWTTAVITRDIMGHVYEGCSR